MSRKITITLSDKAEKYFNEVMYSLDKGDGKMTTQTDVIDEILEVNADFECLTGGDLCGWIDDNFPLHYHETGY